MIDEYEYAEPDEPESLTKKELAEVRQKMYRRITKAFPSDWEKTTRRRA
jgi:hypothetical protein